MLEFPIQVGKRLNVLSTEKVIIHLTASILLLLISPSPVWWPGGQKVATTLEFGESLLYAQNLRKIYTVRFYWEMQATHY